MADITIYLRVSDMQLINSDGGEVYLEEDLPGCAYTQKPVVRLYFREEDGVTPWASLGAGDGFSVAVKELGQVATAAPMARTTTSFTIDPTEGYIEFVLNALTAQWDSAVGVAEDLGDTTRMEVKRIPVGESDVFNIFRFPFITRSLLDSEAEPVDEDPPSVWATIAYVDASLGEKLGADNYAGDWSAGTYTRGEWVTHNGSSWFCIAAVSTTEEPSISATDWAPTALAGAAGLDTLYLPTATVTAFKVYYNAAGTWTLADPDVAVCETCELFLALGTTVADDGMTSDLEVTNPAWTWGAANVGKPLYLDDAGAMTLTVPSSPDDDGRVGRIVGWVRSDTSIRFDGHVPGATFEATVS